MKEKHNLPDAEAKAQLQWERLQSTLNRAYRNVPFHQNRFQKLGIDLSRFESLKDLQTLPFMERTDLGDHYPYGLFAVPLRDIVRIHTAPGTALNPTVSGYTKQDLAIWREMVSRALIAAKVTPHDILQISLDTLANWGRDYKDGAEAIEASVIPNTPLSLEKQLMVLRDYKTSVWVTTPSAAFQLADHLFRIGMNPTGLNLKTVILVGECPDKGERAVLEEQLRVTAWLHYGLNEVPGPAVAFECETHQGLHVNDDHFLPEIIHPQTGDVLSEGPGELVLTSLTTRAYPLIRYRTGDQARLIPEPCPCGRPLSRIEWFSDRTDDMLVIGGIKVSRSQILLHLEQSLGFAPQNCQIRKIQEQATHHLEVQIAMEDRLFSDEIKFLEKLVRTVKTQLEETIGVPVVIRLKETSTH